MFFIYSSLRVENFHIWGIYSEEENQPSQIYLFLVNHKSAFKNPLLSSALRDSGVPSVKKMWGLAEAAALSGPAEGSLSHLARFPHICQRPHPLQ